MYNEVTNIYVYIIGSQNVDAIGIERTKAAGVDTRFAPKNETKCTSDYDCQSICWLYCSIKRCVIATGECICDIC